MDQSNLSLNSAVFIISTVQLDNFRIHIVLCSIHCNGWDIKNVPTFFDQPKPGTSTNLLFIADLHN